MKAYTDLEQSKKLAKILPLESADIWFANGIYLIKTSKEPKDIQGVFSCWSLAALLNVLPKEIEIDGQHYAPCLFPVKNKWLLKLWYNSNYTITSPIAIFADNPVDAYVEMILKLHELKIL